MSSVDIPIVLLDPELPLPTQATAGDAGVDLHARVDIDLLPAGGRAVVPTGIAVAIPAGHAGFVVPRSGIAAHHGVTVLNAPGLIDSGYRGEIAVVLVNTDPGTPHRVRRGDRIAQLVIEAVAAPTFHQVPEGWLSDTARGAGGFGHSGR